MHLQQRRQTRRSISTRFALLKISGIIQFERPVFGRVPKFAWKQDQGPLHPQKLPVTLYAL